MKFLFLTNQASYHQMHYARAMVAELGEDNFRIVFQKPTSDARAEMGWKDDYQDQCILRFWESEADVFEWIEQADVVIQGRFPIKHLKSRINAGKLTFACQERLWKKKPTLGRKLSRLGHFYKNYISVNKPNYHFLAIGRYAAKDLNDMGFFKGRSWQFGYFIDLPEYQARPARAHIQLLWCARLSDVKQPHIALDIVQGLQQRGLSVELTMIGDGQLRKALEADIQKRGLGQTVTLTGWQSQHEVLEHMSKADLFLMTSHHGEGWGLVVNEALSYGSAVVANQALGSAACLVSDGESGVLYSDEDLDAKLDQLARLGRDQILAMGQQGYQAMQSLWSSEVAAKRSIELAGFLNENRLAQAKTLFDDGPGKWLGD